jgi:hypothetical protein
VKKEFVTAEIAAAAGCDRASVVKWLALEGVKPVRIEKNGKRKPFKFYGPDALEVVKSHCKQVAKKNGAVASNFDPETGLTWAQAEMREEALAKRRENEIQDKKKSGEWMEVETHHAILAAVIEKLDSLPGKARSEAGLSDRQMEIIRRLHDEARSSAALEVEELK